MALTFFELKDISERYVEILDPISHEKILKVGEILGFKEGDRVIDFGCGNGEPLALWSARFGISGVGIDIRENPIQRATKKIFQKGLANKIQVVLSDAAKYEFEPNSFDYATCIGATFIWGDFHDAVRAMKKAIKPNGKIAIGECHWLTDNYPPECIQYFGKVYHESELLKFAQDEGFELEFIVRSSHDDWDNYECSNWRGMLKWLEENPSNPDRDDVLKHLHDSQEEYLRYGRKYLGWAIYILKS